MKLSEAIRLGAMVSPQGFDGWMDDDARCALAGAADAAGLDVEIIAQFNPVTRCLTRRGVPYALLNQRFPILRENVIVDGRLVSVGCRIATLNDYHKWTREQIAAWVETIEPKDAPQPASVVEHAAACAMQDGL